MATATRTAPEVFTESTEDAAKRKADKPLTRGQKAAATRRANLEAKEQPTTEKVTARSRTAGAPKVDPMFSDGIDPNEVVDPEGKPEEVTEEDVLATLDLNTEDVPASVAAVKERRMAIQAEFVPGKAALATMTPDALKAIAFVSTYNTVDDQSSSPRQHG